MGTGARPDPDFFGDLTPAKPAAAAPDADFFGDLTPTPPLARQSPRTAPIPFGRAERERQVQQQLRASAIETIGQARDQRNATQRTIGESVDKAYPNLAPIARGVATALSGTGAGLQTVARRLAAPFGDGSTLTPEQRKGGEPIIDPAVRFLGRILKPIGEHLERQGNDLQDVAGAQSGPTGVRDIHSVGDAATFAKNSILNVAGNMAVQAPLSAALGPEAAGASMILQETGSAQQTIDDANTAQGLNIPQARRDRSAIATGVPGGLLENLSFQTLTKPFAGALGRKAAAAAIEGLTGAEATAQAAKPFLRRVAGAVPGIAGEALKDAATEGLTEASQQTLSSGVAPLLAGAQVDWRDVGQQALDAGAGGFAGGLGIGAGGGAVHAASEGRATNRAARHQAYFDTIGKVPGADGTPGSAPSATEAPALPPAAPRERTAAEAQRHAELTQLLARPEELQPDERAAAEQELAAIPPAPTPSVTPTPTPATGERRQASRSIGAYDQLTDEELAAERERVFKLGPDANPLDGGSLTRIDQERARRAAERPEPALPTEVDPLPDEARLAFLHRDLTDEVLQRRLEAERGEAALAPNNRTIQRKIAIVQAEIARRAAVAPASGAAVPHETFTEKTENVPAQQAKQSVEGATVGTSHRIIFPDGGKLQVQYEVRDASTLQPSHSPSTFQPNPAYRADIQGRDYARDQAAQDYLKQSALSYDPDRALDPARGIGAGPTTVLPTGEAIAGNQRLMILKRAIELQPQRYAAYKQQLAENAKDYGLTPEAIQGMTHPVLVRVVTDPTVDVSNVAQLRELNRRSDEVDTKAKRATDEAAATSNALKQAPTVTQHLGETLTTADPNTTLLEYLDSGDGREFVRRLITEGVMSRPQVARYVKGDPARPKLTDDGKGFVRRMLLGTIVGDVALLDDVPASIITKLERAIPALVTINRVPGWSLEVRTRDALRAIADADGKGISLRDSFDQISLDGEQNTTPEKARAMALWLERSKPTAVTAAFREYAQRAVAAQRTAAEDTGFDLGLPAINPDDAFGDLVAATNVNGPVRSTSGAALLAYVPKDTPARAQQDLFGGDEPAPAPADAIVFDPTRTDALYRSAWATVQNDTERNKVARGAPSQAFLDAFAVLRGDRKMLPEEAQLRQARADGGNGAESFFGDGQAELFSPVNGAALPATIMVGGVRRPTTNSEGRPIHPTIEGVRNFWRWFGTSKVVDSRGRPMVLYHGNGRPNRTGVDFTNLTQVGVDQLGVHLGTKEQAANFTATLEAKGVQEPGGRVYPVYVRMQNPLRLVDKGGWGPLAMVTQLADRGLIPGSQVGPIFAQVQQAEDEALAGLPQSVIDAGGLEIARITAEARNPALQAPLRALGYDGVVYLNRYEGMTKERVSEYNRRRQTGGLDSDAEYASEFPEAHDSFIALDGATQIKSAIGNSGAFGPRDPSMVATMRDSRDREQGDLFAKPTPQPGVSPTAGLPPEDPAPLPVKDTYADPNPAKQEQTAAALAQKAIGRFRALLREMAAGVGLNNFQDFSELQRSPLNPARLTRREALDGTSHVSLLEGTRYLGFSITALDALERNGSLEIVGQRVNTVKDVATLMLALRDPSVETGRWIILDKNGTIVGHEAISVGAPGNTRTSTTFANMLYKATPKSNIMGTVDAAAFREALQTRYPNAHTFYQVHNHPSGVPVPSGADFNAHLSMRRQFGELYQGSIVINGTDYAFIPPDVSKNQLMDVQDTFNNPKLTYAEKNRAIAEMFVQPNGLTADPLLTPDPELNDPRVAPHQSDMLRGVDRATSDVAQLVKAMYDNTTATMMTILDANGNVRAVIDVPNSQALGAVDGRKYVETTLRAVGGHFVVFGTTDQLTYARLAELGHRIERILINPDGSITTAGDQRVGHFHHYDTLGTLNTDAREAKLASWFDGPAKGLDWIDKLNRRTVAIKDKLLVWDEASEARKDAAQGIYHTIRQRAAAALEALKGMRETIPALGRVTRDVMTTIVNENLLMLRRAPAHAQKLATDFLAEVTHGLTGKQVDVMTRVLITEDILKDIEKNLYSDDSVNAVPFFGTDEQGERRSLADATRLALTAHLDAVSLMSQDTKMSEAMTLLRDKRAALVQALVDEDLLGAEALTDPRYYHRQVIEYARALDSSTQPRGTKTVRQVVSGFQRRRGGGGEFNTLYVESEYEWLAQSYEKLLARKVEKTIKDVADQAPTLRREVQDINRNTFYTKLQPLMEAYGRGDPVPAWLEALLPPRQAGQQVNLPLGTSAFGTALDPLAPFRQRIGIASSQIYAAVTSGDFRVAQLAPFAGLVRALQRWDEAGRPGYFQHPQWFAFVSALGKDASLPGHAAALGYYAALQQRDATIEHLNGGQQLTWQDLAKERGLALWQPKKGRQLYRATTLAEDVIEQVLNGERDLDRQDLRDVLAQGGLKEQWAVAPHIANALEDPTSGLGTIGKYSAERGWMRLMKGWKFWQLYGPHRFIKYQINNTASDVDVTFTRPAIFSGTLNAIKDLRAEKQGIATMNPQLKAELRLWERHGAIGSGFAAQEIGEVWGHKELERLSDPNPLSVMRLMGAYTHLVTEFAEVRENVLRLAAARYFKAELEKQGRITDFAASNPKIIRALWESSPRDERTTIIAARLARDLVGDYSSISSAGSWLRSRLMPFFSWQEINVKRYFWLMRNVAADPNRSALDVAKLGAAGLFRGGLNAAMLALKVHVFYLAATLWNRWRYPDEEEKLRREGRGLHLITSVDMDGAIHTLRIESAWAALLKLASLEDWPADLNDIRQSKKSIATQADEMVHAPFNAAIQQLEPATKGIYEALAGVSLYPDPSHPRPLKEPGRDWMNGQGIGYLNDLYRKVTGAPIPPSRPGVTAPGLSLPQRFTRALDTFATYRTDPGEAAYWNTRQMIADFTKQATGKETQPARLNDMQLALYYFKAASRWGDEAKAQEWLTRYYQKGGTPQGARGSVRHGDPFEQIPNAIQGKFLRSLSPEDRAMVDEARRWWKDDQRDAARNAMRGVSYSKVRSAMKGETP